MPKFPYDPLNHCLYLRDGRFDGPNGLPRIMQTFKESGDDTMVVHFHGGLVDRAAGQNAADYLFAECYGADAYPVFFIWESGIREMLHQSLPEIVQNTLFRVLLEQVSRFTIGKAATGTRSPGDANFAMGTRDMAAPLAAPNLMEVQNELEESQSLGIPAFSGIVTDGLTVRGELSPNEEAEFIRALQNDGRLAEESRAIASALQEEATPALRSRSSLSPDKTYPVLAPELKAELKAQVPPADGGEVMAMRATRGGLSTHISFVLIARVVRILKSVLARFRDKTDHGMQATIIEEILREVFLGSAGRVVWQQMKKDTADAFGGDAATCGGTAFLTELRKLQEAGAAPQRIVLVGHSTGAIYIAELLKHAHHMLPDVQFEVIFLAPACDFSTMRKLLENHGGQISQLRIFGMQDSVERSEFLLEVEELENLPLLQRLYPGSLLYFVSGVLEEKPDWPLVGMARYYSGAEPYNTPELISVKNRLAESPNSFVWSIVQGSNGLSSGSAKHGDFDNDEKTIHSLKHLLKSGFAGAR